MCACAIFYYFYQYLIVFPPRRPGYAVLDLPEASPAASAANAALRAAILTPAANGTASTADSLELSSAGLAMVSRYGTHGVALPLLAGIVIRALLPSPLSKKVSVRGVMILRFVYIVVYVHIFSYMYVHMRRMAWRCCCCCCCCCCCWWGWRSVRCCLRRCRSRWVK